MIRANNIVRNNPDLMVGEVSSVRLDAVVLVWYGEAELLMRGGKKWMKGWKRLFFLINPNYSLK